MKKSYLLFPLLLMLGFGAWYSYRKASRKSTLEKLDLNFSVTDTASIDRIIVEPVAGKISDLKKTGNDRWILNEKYRVSPVLMDVLLTTIRNVEMLRPLSKTEAQTAIEGIEKRGKKITIFVGGELYKTYRIGDDAPGNKGTYLQMENGDPYVAYLRGFNGFLSPRYDVRENDWRDRLLISCSPENIKTLRLQYRKEPFESIDLSISGRYIILAGAGRFDTSAAAGILSSFKRIYAEKYMPYFPARQRDSLLKAGCAYSVSLQGADKECNKTLQLFETNDPGRSIAYMPETNEWLTIQNQVLFQAMLRKSALLR